MNNILNLFKKNNNIKEIIRKIEGEESSLFCAGMTLNVNVLFLASLLKEEKNQSIVYVLNNSYKANIAYDTLTDVLGLDDVNLYLADDFASIEAFAISNELKSERINTLSNIYEKKKRIIVTDIQTILRPLQSFENYEKGIITLRKGEELDINSFIKNLIISGYERESTTYKQGQYSVRGEVIDVFPIGYKNPIRINVSFDEIETLKIFDEKTQLSTGEMLDSATIYPINELVLTFDIDKLWDDLRKKGQSEYLDDDFTKIKELKNYDNLLKYIKYIDKNYEYFFNYFDALQMKYIVCYDQINNLEDIVLKLQTEVSRYLETRASENKLELSFYDDASYVMALSQRNIYLSETKKAMQNLELHGIYDFHSYKVTKYDNDMKYFVKAKKDTDIDIYLTYSTDTQKDLIEDTLQGNEIKYEVIDDFFNIGKEKFHLVNCDNAIGYGIIGEYEVLTVNELFSSSKSKKPKYRNIQDNTSQINSKDDLHVGDYIVHYDYGIGKYLGLQTVELNKVKNDYLKLQYENLDLLIPVEKITDLEKYLGAEGVVPKLTKVGTNEWEKKKQTVRNQLESIAKELIELQIKRSSNIGFKYKEDSDLQKQFENDFEYEETPDQIKIVDEIKTDMENGVLMDRLVCGDVGFGKTEVAMRAAFKTVYEGKQVAYMAPTTILTRQHYHTFKERFSKYGIRVALLNRLVSPNEQKEIIKDLKKGDIDIIVGTHRLLNKEIGYNDLGLLIIDEEQRFGVEHKEKIKKLKENVNVITLTATPIPRTLQMAVTGIRTLSLLETPPKDRYPIQTYVLEYEETIIREAIYRELARNGQVFYLHNRVSDIYLVAKKIQSLVPEAKICVGHGKMNRNELEDIVSDYIDGVYNVMVCTTIIETGIDIPNSNTLIVDDASRLGLAQMYQIRGRVGRTDRIAYAYFLYKSENNLSSAAEKRLSAIKEYNRIGSGYKIAVRDLAIRGAGDILGREQSGFINSIGIDMYMKLLNEAINKAKGIEEKKRINYKIQVAKHVEKEYVNDDSIIIYIHKEINKIETKEDRDNVIAELTDRFGKLSDNILNYVEERYLEALLRRIEVTNVIEEDRSVKLEIPENYSNKLKGDEVMYAGYTISRRFSIDYKYHMFIITISKEYGDRSWLYLMTEFLEKIIK